MQNRTVTPALSSFPRRRESSLNFLLRMVYYWIPAFAGMTMFLWFSVSAAATDPLKEFPSRVKKITLNNGLRVLIVERPESPTVSFAMYIRTGGIDDESGRSGLAHMFEHMLFKGTKTIGTKDFAKEAKILDQIDAAAKALQEEEDKPSGGNPALIKKCQEQMDRLEADHQNLLVKQEFWQIYERAGGEDMNAGTGFDYTTYTVSLPKNQLKLWAAMEADRIANPVLREFYKERSVVLEERRLRVDSSSQGRLWENFLAAAFVAHPYGRPILGWESDISRVTRPEAEKFFKDHYDISRMVVAVVGGVKTAEVQELFRQVFQPIPSYPSHVIPKIPAEPVQEGERRVQVEFDAEPSLMMGYHRPKMLHPDDPVFEVIEDLLSGGRTSRFNKNIVEKKKMAVSAWAGSAAPGERAPNLFVLGGSPRAPHTAEELEKALTEEVDKMRTEGPTPLELEKVKKNVQASLIRGLSSNQGMADHLAYYEALSDDWQNLFRLIEAIQAVSADDVKRVLKTYCTPSNRTVAVLVRKKV